MKHFRSRENRIGDGDSATAAIPEFLNPSTAIVSSLVAMLITSLRISLIAHFTTVHYSVIRALDVELVWHLTSEMFQNIFPRYCYRAYYYKPRTREYRNFERVWKFVRSDSEWKLMTGYEWMHGDAWKFQESVWYTHIRCIRTWYGWNVKALWANRWSWVVKIVQ